MADKDVVAVELLGKLEPLVQEVSNAISRTNDLVSQIKVRALMKGRI